MVTPSRMIPRRFGENNDQDEHDGDRTPKNVDRELPVVRKSFVDDLNHGVADNIAD